MWHVVTENEFGKGVFGLPILAIRTYQKSLSVLKWYRITISRFISYKLQSFLKTVFPIIGT